MTKFFLSYRHDSERLARRLCAGVRRHFRAHAVEIYFDFPRGAKIPSLVQAALDQCMALLVLVDAAWTAHIGELANPADWVRIEIAGALDRGIPIVPSVVSPSRLPLPEQMPEELRDFAYCNGVQLDGDERFDDDVANLARHLQRIERDHRWADACLTEVRRQVQAGDWPGARDACRRACEEGARSPGRSSTRVFPQLRHLEPILYDLSEASDAFKVGNYASAKSRLQRTPGVVAKAGQQLADIGVSAADAVRRGNYGQLRRQRSRLAKVLHRIDGNLVVPGQTEIASFLGRGEAILLDMAKLKTEARTMYEAAVFDDDCPDLPLTHDDVVADLLATAHVPLSELEWFDGASGPNAFDANPPDLTTANVFAEMADGLPSLVDFINTARPAESRISGRDLLAALGVLKPHSSGLLFKKAVVVRLDSILPAALQAIPGGRLDRIQFTVVAPASIQPGATAPIAICAHLFGDQGRALRAVKDLGTDGLTEEAHREGRGTLLTAKFGTRDLQVSDPIRGIEPRGDCARAVVLARASSTLRPGMAQMVIDVLLDGLRMSRLEFVLKIGAAPGPLDFLPHDEVRLQRVFASFATADEAAVVPRLHDLSALAPGMAFNLRCVESRREAGWRDRIARVIQHHDQFYLFWSSQAAASEEMAHEWRAALTQGSQFISGILLGPDSPPLPAELSDLPFQSWTRAAERVT